MVVEVDVRDHRDLGPERLDRAVGLVALDDEPAFPHARVRRRAAAPRRRRARPGRARARAARTRPSPRSSSCRARPRRRSTAASRRARRAAPRASGPGSGTRSRRRPRDPPAPPARATRAPRARPRGRRRGTASRAGPSRRPRRPRRARAGRRRSSRRRRSRSARAAYPRASAISSSAIPLGGVGPRELPHRLATSAPAAPRRRAASGRPPGRGRAPVSGTTIAPPPRGEVARVLRLVVAGRERVGHEHGGRPGGGELPDRAARAREREARGGEDGAEVLGRRQHAVASRVTRDRTHS